MGSDVGASEVTGLAFAGALVVVSTLAWDGWRRWLGRREHLDADAVAKLDALETRMRKAEDALERAEAAKLGRGR